MNATRKWTGWTLSGLAAAFLAFDVTIKLISHPEAVKATAALGWPDGSLLAIGIIELICLVAYLVPRTAVAGAILWTGYFGGAIATHMRTGDPLFSHTLFPLYVAAFIWGGLALRDRRVLALLSAK